MLHYHSTFIHWNEIGDKYNFPGMSKMRVTSGFYSYYLFISFYINIEIPTTKQISSYNL